MNEPKSVMAVWFAGRKSWIATYPNGKRRHLGYDPLMREGGPA